MGNDGFREGLGNRGVGVEDGIWGDLAVEIWMESEEGEAAVVFCSFCKKEEIWLLGEMDREDRSGFGMGDFGGFGGDDELGDFGDDGGTDRRL